MVSEGSKYIYFKMELRELMKSVYLVRYLGDLWKIYIHIQEDWDRNNIRI